MACDDAVLYTTKQEGRDYAAAMLRVAESFDNTVPAGAGFLGMLELPDNLLLRIRSTLDGTRTRRFSWRSAVFVLAFLVFLIPMGTWSSAGRNSAYANEHVVAAKTESAPPASPAQAPNVVSTAPANGATEVDPALDRITATFDQDMEGGFSWTGGPPSFPKTTGKPQWVDKRNCAIPVQLEKGKFYRLGINSSSYHNFRSAAGVPVRPQVLMFTTRGADPSVMAAMAAPKVVSLSPENEATGVPATLDRLTVTFDHAMGSGFSWTGGGQSYPDTTGKPQWSEDKKTCTLPVKLKPNWAYVLGLNSPNYNNFQSENGVQLEPVEWQFSTAGK